MRRLGWVDIEPETFGLDPAAASVTYDSVPVEEGAGVNRTPNKQQQAASTAGA